MITCLNSLNDCLLINTAKQNYYYKIAEKLQNAQRSSEAYWSLLKIFLNNLNKIAIIPSLYHKNKFVTNFKKKAELFSSFFVDQFLSLVTVTSFQASSNISHKVVCHQLLSPRTTLQR